MFYIDNDANTIEKYDMKIFLDFDDNLVFDCLNSYMLYSIPKLTPSGYLTVRSDQENRPDLLAFDIYGDTQYWWILMWYNSLLYPKQIKAGLKIKYPSLNSIDQLYTNVCLNEKTT